MTHQPVVLGITLYRVVFAEACAHLLSFVVDCLNRGFPLHIKVETNMYVTWARNNIAAYAVERYLAGEASHLLMVDDDMLIPAAALEHLIARDVPVVGGLYYGRDMAPISYSLDTFRRDVVAPVGGLHRRDGLGCGCTLVRCDVLEQMARRYRDNFWFQNTIKVGERTDYLGEDVFFFTRLKEMGVPVYLDADVRCGHLGNIIIDHEGVVLRQRALAEGLIAEAPDAVAR